MVVDVESRKAIAELANAVDQLVDAFRFQLTRKGERPSTIERDALLTAEDLAKRARRLV